jgi:signal transduction histidine kinase
VSIQIDNKRVAHGVLNALQLSGNLNDSVASIDEMLQETKRMLKFGANSADVAIDIFVPKYPPPIRVDVFRFHQVLINLASNAVKFSPAGRKVSMIAATEANGGLLIRVKDSGIGMRTIARILVEAHGGKLMLQSEMGVGTTATIRLPHERFVSPVANDLQVARVS